MPSIEIQDCSGRSYRCQAFTPETAARWLYETVAAIADPNPAWGDLRIRMEPIFFGNAVDPKPDWTPNAVLNGYYSLNFENAPTNYAKAQVLISKLQELAEAFLDE